MFDGFDKGNLKVLLKSSKVGFNMDVDNYEEYVNLELKFKYIQSTCPMQKFYILNAGMFS